VRHYLRWSVEGDTVRWPSEGLVTPCDLRSGRWGAHFPPELSPFFWLGITIPFSPFPRLRSAWEQSGWRFEPWTACSSIIGACRPGDWVILKPEESRDGPVNSHEEGDHVANRPGSCYDGSTHAPQYWAAPARVQTGPSTIGWVGCPQSVGW
jgi:hypothetical protein